MTNFAVSRRVAELYDDHILPHVEATEHRGRIPCPTCSGTLRNPRCGDEVRLDLLIDSVGHVTAARFYARGCLISQAAAAILCEFIEGQPMAHLQQLTAQEMLGLLKIPLSPMRLQCGLLAFNLLKVLVQPDGQQADRRDGPAGWHSTPLTLLGSGKQVLMR